MADPRPLRIDGLGRVLIVDDSPVARSLLTRQLRAAGYETREASDGRSALRLLAAEAFDVVLTDLRMPSMDGFELLEAVKQHALGTEVIVVTASLAGSADAAIRALRLGANDFLSKLVAPSDQTVLAVRDAVERKRQRDAVREAEARYRGLFDRVPVGLYRTAPCGRIVDANPAFIEMVGAPDRATLLATSAPSLYVDAGERRRFQECLERDGVVSRFEALLRRLDGSVRWVEESARLVRGADGQVYYDGSLQDITERRCAEQARRDVERRLNEAQRLAHVGSWEWDLSSGALSWSDEQYRIHALAPVGARVDLPLLVAQIHPEDRELVERAGQDALSSGEPFEYLYRIVLPGGAVRRLHCRGQALRDASGRVVRLLGADQDVTGLHEAQEALSIKTEQLEAVAQAMITFLAKGDVQAASAGLLRTAVAQTHSSSGFIALVQDGPKLKVLAQEGELWNEPAGQEFCASALQARPAGEPPGVWRGSGPGASLGVPIVVGSEVVGVIGVAHRAGGYGPVEQARLDILTRASGVIFESCRQLEHARTLERELRQAQKMEAIGRLAGGVAHDFNNLLTVITGYAELLLQGFAADDPRRGRAEGILKAGASAAALTRQLLMFSRKQFVEPCILDLDVVVTETTGMLQRLVGEDVEIVTALRAAHGRVKADRGHLEQLLLNLAANARDAMPAGGRLTFETAFVELPPSATQPDEADSGRYVRLIVSDDGQGMSAEAIAHVFEPFFTTKQAGRGTGLGLAGVYGIVKQAGGRISVESTPALGTRFQIDLPRVDASAAPAASSSSAARASSGGSETVLLVEDEQGLRSLLAEMIAGLGYRVLAPDDVEQAQELAASHPGPIDLLLSDVVMPGLSGPDLAAKLSLLRPGLRILYMSGYTDATVLRERVLATGAAFLQKPFSLQVLAPSLRAALDGP